MGWVGCDNVLPIGGELHMEKVPGKGVAGGKEVVEGNADPEIKPGCAPDSWGIEGSTVEDDNNDPALG